MSRALTIKNLYDKKHSTFKLSEPWLSVFGEPENSGLWLIWGAEKNGKTWFALQLANYLSSLTSVIYLSAEEGTGKAFIDNCKRSKINIDNKHLLFYEYLSISELTEKLSKKRSANVVILDNITIYADELKNGILRKLTTMFPSKLFIFLAHEDRNEPYTAVAKLTRKLAKVIVYVKGLTCNVSGRVPGGVLVIDEIKAKLFYGNEIEENEN